MALRPRTLHGPLLALAAVMAVLWLVSLGGLLFDDRQVLGEPIWTKTFKFTVSIAVFAVTMAWLLSLLPRARRWGWWMGTVVALGLGVDMALLVFQMIVRGERLHFNVADDTDQLIHNLLAAGVYTAFLATVVIAALLSFQRLRDPAQASAVRGGLGVALLGMAVANLMFHATPHPDVIGAHAVGVPDGGAGLPVVGWSTDGGDLRVAHFAGLHGLQVLPLVALVLHTLSMRYAVLRSPLVRRGLVRICTAAYVALVVALTWQALRGQPLIAPDGQTALVWAAIAVAAVAGGCVVGRERPRAPPGAAVPVSAQPER